MNVSSKVWADTLLISAFKPHIKLWVTTLLTVNSYPLKYKRNDKMFYNGNKALTYNCLFNFIIGNRGSGKTYWSKEWCISDFLKTGNQFIYLRRYDTEFEKGNKEKFFDDIKEKFEGHEFEVKGYNAYIDKKVAGYFIPLSKAKIKKSTPFPRVNKIIYDEFILDKKSLYHYLGDEVITFLEFYETVARTRDNVRTFFLSNAITVTNPYFLYFNIKPTKKKIKRYGDEILLEMVEDNEFIEMKSKTRFGKLIKGTKYGDYAIENQFLRDDDTFIGKKTGNAKYYFTLKYKGIDIGVYVDFLNGKYFVSDDVDKSCKLIYCVTLDDHSINTMLVKGKQSRILNNFTQNYKLGNVIFENQNLKNLTYDIIRLFLL